VSRVEAGGGRPTSQIPDRLPSLTHSQMSVPPDPPHRTQRLPATAVGSPAVDAVYLEPEEILWRDEVRSRLRSLTTALTIAVAVAFVALGVALWALLGDRATNDGIGRERVDQLEQRVDRLEGLAAGRATRKEVRGIQDQQRVLSERLATLEQSGDDVAALQTATQATQQAVEQLDQRMDALEQTTP
jgi:hypothetical protein